MTVLRCPRCGDTRFRRSIDFLGTRTEDVACDPTTGTVSIESVSDVSIYCINELTWTCDANRHKVSDPDLVSELEYRLYRLTVAQSR
jgi:hypothetical protein